MVSQRHGGSGAALLDRDRFTARTREPAAALAAFEERRPDCLVTCVETIPAALAARASHENCPVVDLPSEEAVDTDALAARITAAVDGAAGADRDRITRLHRAALALIDAESENELFERTVDIAETVLEFDRPALFVVEDGPSTVVAGRGGDSSEGPPEERVLFRTDEEERSILVTDVDETPAASPTYETTNSVLSVPVGDGVVFQALSSEAGAFDETDLEHAELLAASAGAALSRIRSEQALRERRQPIEGLHDAATDIAAAETEQEVLDSAIAAAEELLAFHQCSIGLREGETLVPAIQSSDTSPDGTRAMHGSERLKRKTARTGESFRVDEIADGNGTEPTRPEYRSGISIPIGDLGVFQAIATEPNAFDAGDVSLAELLMAHVAVSLERVRAKADLRAKRDRLEALFENVPGAAISYEMVDGEPVVSRGNSSFERTFGYDEAEIVDEPLDEVLVPADTEAEAERYSNRLERGERIQAAVERQTVDGRRQFLLQVVPLEIGEENSRGYAIYTDVTDQREREAALRRQNERLAQFASVVSHDLRNPLNVASGYLELARETGSEEQFDRVERALEHMDELVADLLTLAREGRDVGETEPIALDQTARTAWSHVASEGVRLAVETDRRIEADQDRLIELLENLYRNTVEHGSTSSRPEADDTVEHGSTGSQTQSEDTVEHRRENTPAGGGTDADDALTVTVSDLCEGAEWRGFVVADNGVGIDPSIDPFETGTTTSEEGTGFGLAIVEGIAEAHGWSVTAAESDDGGARFEFRVE